MTKINEELVIWNNNAVKPVGEFAVVIGPPQVVHSADPPASDVAELFGQITESTRLSEAAVLAMAAVHFQISTVRARKLLKKGRILLKRAHDNL